MMLLVFVQYLVLGTCFLIILLSAPSVNVLHLRSPPSTLLLKDYYNPLFVHEIHNSTVSVGEMKIVGIHNIGSNILESDTYWFAQNQQLETSALLSLMKPFSVFALSFHLSMSDDDHTLILNHGKMYNTFSGWGSVRHYTFEQFLNTLEHFLMYVHTESFVFVEINMDQPDSEMQDLAYNMLSQTLFFKQNLAFSYEDLTKTTNGWPTLHKLIHVLFKRVCFLTFGFGPHVEHLMPKLWLTHDHKNMTIQSEDRTWAGHGIGWLTTTFLDEKHHINPLIQGPIKPQSTSNNGPHLIFLDQISSPFDVRFLETPLPVGLSADLSIFGNLYYVGEMLNNISLKWFVSFVLFVYLAMMLYDYYQPCFLLSGLASYGIILLFPQISSIISMWMITVGCLRFAFNSKTMSTLSITSYYHRMNEIFEFRLPMTRPQRLLWPTFLAECFVYYFTFILIVLRLSTFAKQVIPLSLTIYSIFLLFLFLWRCLIWTCYQSHMDRIRIMSYLVTIFQSNFVLYCWWTIHLPDVVGIGLVFSLSILLLELSLFAILLICQKRKTSSSQNQEVVEMPSLTVVAALAPPSRQQMSEPLLMLLPVSSPDLLLDRV